MINSSTTYRFRTSWRRSPLRLQAQRVKLRDRNDPIGPGFGRSGRRLPNEWCHCRPERHRFPTAPLPPQHKLSRQFLISTGTTRSRGSRAVATDCARSDSSSWATSHAGRKRCQSLNSGIGQ